MAINTVYAYGHEFAVSDCGGGVPLLFVHGFPLNHTMWAAQIETFCETHRVIAPDLRGLGASEAGSGTMTMEAFADDLAGILDELGVDQPVVLCGLSMGGYIAFAFWRKYAARLRGLVLADTRAAADTPEAAGGRLTMAETVLSKGHQPLLEKMRPNLFWSLTLERAPEIVQSVEAMFASASRAGIAAALRGMACRSDFTDVLPEIDVPALVIAGEDDRLTPPVGMRRIAAALPRAEYVEVPAAGHMSPMENAPAFNAALMKFMRGLQ